MALLGLIPIIGPILEKIVNVVDKAVPDKDLATKLKADLEKEIAGFDYNLIEKEIEAKAQVLVAEISGQSWLQRSWRPILMLSITAIVVNNYILYPYLALFGIPATALELPDKLWNLMTLGVGGYIVGRTVEKGVETWKGK